MKRILILVLIFVFLLSVKSVAENIEDEIKKEINSDSLVDIVPDSITENEELSDLDLTYENSNKTISVNSVLNKISRLLSLGIREEVSFVLTALSALILSKLLKIFSESLKNTGIKESINLLVSVFFSTFLCSHVFSSLERVTLYIDELLGFVKALLPFLTTLLCMQGGGAEAVGSSAVLMTVTALLQSLCREVVVPLVKILFAFICAGFVSGLNFSAICNLATTVAAKTCTIGMSVLSAIMYFQNSLASSADSLALRSVKLFAANFIPIIGSNISEAASTLISGVKLVKSTLGVFAFAVLLYLTLSPIISFLVKKLSLRIVCVTASLFGCEQEAKILNSVAGVYNLLSAIMLSSCTFFIIAIAIFVKSGGF